MTTFSQRLDRGLLACSLTQSDLARMVCISRQTMSMLKQRRDAGFRSGLKYLPEMAKILKCDPQWLATGSGPAPAWWTPDDKEKQSFDEALRASMRDMMAGLEKVVLEDLDLRRRELEARVARLEARCHEFEGELHSKRGRRVAEGP